MVLKTDENNFARRKIVANVIKLDEVNFLCGKETINEWRTKVNFEDDKLDFKGKDKYVELTELEEGHLLAKLELVGTWKNDDTIYQVEKRK